jgi:hypothetical protein
VSVPEANALLVGGPQPIGSRYLRADQGASELRASAADGSGLHVWQRTTRFAPKPGGGLLRVFVYQGADDEPIPL